MKRCRLVLVVGALCLLPGTAGPQETGKKEDPAHDELRALKKDVEEALNKGDLDKVLTFLDKDVVVTWMNGEVSKGPQGVREYYERMTKGPNRVVDVFKTAPVVDDLTHLYGNTGVAYGSSKDYFKLTDGSEFTVPTRWSATVVKENGRWKIANFHASTNVFDNPVLWLGIRRTAWWAGGIALVVGLLLGGAVIWFLKRRRAGGSPNVPGTTAAP
jgi:uncharacterized protein (TIGR02246 family)